MHTHVYFSIKPNFFFTYSVISFSFHSSLMGYLAFPFHYRNNCCCQLKIMRCLPSNSSFVYFFVGVSPLFSSHCLAFPLYATALFSQLFAVLGSLNYLKKSFNALRDFN